MTAHALIEKSRSKKKPFRVNVIGENGESLMHPQLLTTMKNVTKNLLAVMRAFSGSGINVINKFGKEQKSYRLYSDGTEA